jgi:hypothetical protein
MRKGFCERQLQLNCSTSSYCTTKSLLFHAQKRLETEHVARLPISSTYQIVVNLPCVNIKVFLKHGLVSVRPDWMKGG